MKYHVMKKYKGVEIWLHHSLTVALDGGESSASRFCRFNFYQTASGTDLIAGLGGSWY
jgi:penicillin V acylase-like amidase (Ntn superfamily)